MSDVVQGGTALSRVEHGGDQRCDDGAAVPDHPKEFLCGGWLCSEASVLFWSRVLSSRKRL